MLKQAILSLMLAAPAAAQASDGYKFLGNPPALRYEFSTKVVEYNSRQDLLDAFKSFGGHSEVHAFSTFDGKVCTVHIIKPANKYLPEHIGHELMHCVYGKWHK